jgi:hypothetical protein
VQRLFVCVCVYVMSVFCRNGAVATTKVKDGNIIYEKI